MSELGADDRSGPAGRTPGRRPRQRWTPAWAILVGVIAPATLMTGAGCNAPLMFGDRKSNVTGPDAAVDSHGDADPDLGVSPPDLGPVDVAVDTPADVGVDLPQDVPVDMAPDLPAPDVMPDLPRDLPRDVPRDIQPDGGPVVCTATGGECRPLGMSCLITAGQPGRCVECNADGECPGKRCDLTAHRCVQCLAPADCPITPGTEASHPSQCTPDHHCLAGCDDSANVPCQTLGFNCVGSGVDLCIDCTTATVTADCPATFRFCVNSVCAQCTNDLNCSSTSPQTPLCDTVSGRCVQCRDSRDCKQPNLPVCDLKMLACVPAP